MKKIALITALVIGTASVAFAEDGFDPNLANRYPGYAAPKSHSMTTRNVGLGSGSGSGSGSSSGSSSSSWTATQSPTFDRASNPNAGGV